MKIRQLMEGEKIVREEEEEEEEEEELLIKLIRE